MHFIIFIFVLYFLSFLPVEYCRDRPKGDLKCYSFFIQLHCKITCKISDKKIKWLVGRNITYLILLVHFWMIAFASQVLWNLHQSVSSLFTRRTFQRCLLFCERLTFLPDTNLFSWIRSVLWPRGRGRGQKVSLCVDATCQQATVAARHHFSVNM